MKNKNKLKTFIVIFCIFSFISFSFATGEKSQDIGIFHNFIALATAVANLLSIIWFVLPVIAWKLLTNDFVYGTFIHMDVILWKIWNFSRTFANFIIWFIFILIIFKYLVYLNDKNAAVLKEYLPKIVLWSIVVNASWFIIGVLIDISTILIISFWSLPAYIFKQINNTDIKLALVTDYKIEKWCKDEKYCLWGFTFKQNTNKQKTITLRKVLQYESDIAGPLTFLMNSVVDITAVSSDFMNDALDENSKIYTDWWSFMKLISRILIIFLFTIPIIVLIIVSLVRIFYLRLYISFSPLIFLDNIFWNKLISSKAAFKISNMIWLIFQPVIVVGAFSLGIIFLAGIIWVIDKNSAEEYKKYESSVLKTFDLENSSAWAINNKYFQIQDTTQKMSRYVWWFFGYLFILVLSIGLVWSLIKLAFAASKITSNITDKVFNFVEESFYSVPFVPTPWWRQSIGSLERVWAEVNAYPWTRMAKQVHKLNDRFFNIVPDIDPNLTEKYLESLDSISKNKWVSSDKDNLNKLFNEFEKYSWKENFIKQNKNMRKLLGKVEEILKSKFNSSGPGLKNGWVQDMIKEKDDAEKLRILLKNETAAKKILLNNRVN